MLSRQELKDNALKLLCKLIETPSLSREENATAALIGNHLKQAGITFKQHQHNIWAFNQYYDSAKPTILLNSHHDTVKPNKGYTRDPFKAIIEDDKLYGLGSNDAGGCLTALIATFIHYYSAKDLKYNLIIAATAEEEISGRGGIESIIEELGEVDFAIVGEPTLMDMAVAEKGLMVWDCLAEGKAGHAARNEGENALYKAVNDIQKIRNFKFDKESAYLGPVKLSVTQINAGYQHNVVPDRCDFVVDVRTTDAYTNEEVVEILQRELTSTITPRSTRLRSSSIPENHPIVQAGKKMGMQAYGSPTMSDQAIIPFQSIKIGPGDSARSHTPDEFIYLREIEEGVDKYIALIAQIM